MQDLIDMQTVILHSVSERDNVWAPEWCNGKAFPLSSRDGEFESQCCNIHPSVWPKRAKLAVCGRGGILCLPYQSQVTLTNHGCLWAHSHRDGQIILLFCVQELTAKPDLRIYLREFSFTWLDSVTSDWQRRERDATPPSLTVQAILLSFLISGW